MYQEAIGKERHEMSENSSRLCTDWLRRKRKKRWLTSMMRLGKLLKSRKYRTGMAESNSKPFPYIDLFPINLWTNSKLNQDYWNAHTFLRLHLTLRFTKAPHRNSIVSSLYVPSSETSHINSIAPSHAVIPPCVTQGTPQHPCVASGYSPVPTADATTHMVRIDGRLSQPWPGICTCRNSIDTGTAGGEPTPT